MVFGHYDQNIARIERSLGVSANANGNQVVIKGPREASEQARRVFEMLYERVKLGQPASEGDVEGVIDESAYQGLLFPGDEGSKESFGIVKTRKRGVVRARNAAQDHYLAALRKHELVFAEGPAGTGKTWLAVGHAVSLLEQGLVERLVLSRPAVEAGERLGFLPGDMRDKVDPYLRPIYDALYDFMDGRMVERGIQTGMIEIAPLAFMRGRTLSKAAILLDEAQNATAMQMKMFLTRLGEGSRMMVNGDPTQTDLAPGQKSGLGDAISASRVDAAHRPCPLHPWRRRAPRSGAPDRRSLRTRGPRGTTDRRQMKVKLDISVPSTLVARLAAGAWPGARDDRRRRRGERKWPRATARRSASALPTTRGCARSTCAGAASTSRPTCSLFRPRRPTARGRRRRSAISRSPSRRWRARRSELGVPLADHYRHLVAHGFLHLIGFDHETDEEAERMEALETRILARLGVADPYARKVVDG